MIQKDSRVRIKENALGYLHPNMCEIAKGRNTFQGEPSGTVIQVPEIDRGFAEYFVRLDVLSGEADPDVDIYAFVKADLIEVEE